VDTLRVMTGPEAGRVLELHTPVVIGRLAECDLVLTDASISRRHARVERSADGWVVRDEGSRNGLWSEGERVPVLRLTPGMEFRLGEVAVRLESQTDEVELELELPEPATAPAPRTAARPVERASAAATRGLLQYNKVEQREGLVSTDFSQMSGWMKCAVLAVAVAVFVGLFWLAFYGGAWLRSGS
jgi:predicted component of type VI protein secretion system